MLKCDFVSVSVFDTSYQLLSAVNQTTCRGIFGRHLSEFLCRMYISNMLIVKFYDLYLKLMAPRENTRVCFFIILSRKSFKKINMLHSISILCPCN